MVLPSSAKPSLSRHTATARRPEPFSPLMPPVRLEPRGATLCRETWNPPPLSKPKIALWRT
eukprot:2529554-Amphidinium_carterae.1